MRSTFVCSCLLLHPKTRSRPVFDVLLGQRALGRVLMEFLVDRTGVMVRRRY